MGERVKELFVFLAKRHIITTVVMDTYLNELDTFRLNPQEGFNWQLFQRITLKRVEKPFELFARKRYFIPFSSTDQCHFLPPIPPRVYAMVSVGGGGKSNLNYCTAYILHQAQPFVSMSGRCDASGGCTVPVACKPTSSAALLWGGPYAFCTLHTDKHRVLEALRTRIPCDVYLYPAVLLLTILSPEAFATVR